MKERKKRKMINNYFKTVQSLEDIENEALMQMMATEMIESLCNGNKIHLLNSMNFNK